MNIMPRVVNKRLMTGARLALSIIFVVRCSSAATLSYILANAIGLPYPVWASISGIIVSQEKLIETHNAMAGRFFGTLIGTASTVVVSSLLSPYDVGIAGQMTIAVAICAIIAFNYPALRLCMWTCPIVFLSANPMTSIFITGLYRSSEVILGSIVGVMLHTVAEAIIRHSIKLHPPDASDENQDSPPISLHGTQDK